MQVRVRLLGSGSASDPYRVSLPQYTILGNPDMVTHAATVEVPASDMPRDLSTAVQSGTLPPAGPQLAALVAQWRSFLDTRYTEHVGQFLPDLV